MEKGKINQNNNVFVVIPAYNESKMILNVVNDLRNQDYFNIVIIDDGSTDDTYKVALSSGVIVLKQVINRGQGAALKTGIDYAVLSGAKVIVTFDADGQHNSKEINNLVKPVLNNEVDVTLGSRFIGKRAKNIPFIRKIFLKGGSIIIRIFYGIKLTDSHNGFRALSRKAAKLINIKSDRMEHASEILEQIKRQGLSYKEVPVTIKYTEYSLRKGQNTLNAFNILFKMIKNKIIR